MKPITLINCGIPRQRVGPGEYGNAPYQATRTAERRQDSVEISEAALRLGELQHTTTGRTDRIRRVLAAVRGDNYVTNKKIEWVVSRLLDELHR